MHRKLTFIIYILATGLIIMTSLFVYNNLLYRSLNEIKKYSQTFDLPVLKIQTTEWLSSEITAPGQKYKNFKLSFPIIESAGGCEFTYSLAVVKYSDTDIKENKSYFTEPRYLLRYKYDLKNKRCESNDLSFLDNDIPESISIQNIRLNIKDEYITETADSFAYQINLDRNLFLISNIQEKVIDKNYPFIPDSRTKRNQKFSVTNLANPIEAVFTPYQDLSQIVINEFKSRIDKCRNGQGCDSIYIAVSKISDLRIIEKISEAQQAGIQINWLANGSVRTIADSNGSIAIKTSPLFWLRGSLVDGRFKGYLPMHTKFFVFGDDLVISNSTNYDLDKARGSKQAALVYKDPKIAEIFHEIYNIVKTNLYYPVHVDLNDSAIILFHAERSPAYTIMSKRPYLQVGTNEGVSSSGYGVALEILRKASQPSWLSMAPMSNSCYQYNQRLCFFDIIKNISEDTEIFSSLNSFFYVKPGAFNTISSSGALLTSESAADNLDYFEESLQSLIELFSKHPDHLSLQIGTTFPGSNLHFRSALINKEYVVNGSGNWAFPFSLNTIEIIKDQNLYKSFLTEISTHSSPYFIFNDPLKRRPYGRYETCEFIFEKNYLTTNSYKSRAHNYSTDLIKQEMLKKYQIEIDDSWINLKPADTSQIFENSAAYFKMEFSREQLNRQNISSDSPYFCLLKPESNQTYVVRIANNEDPTFKALSN